MANLITTYKAKTPDFVAYPISKKSLGEYLQSVPLDSIDLHFRSWSQEGGFQREPNSSGRKIGLRGDKQVDIFWCSAELNDEWSISICPVRKPILKAVKDALHTEGLTQLRDWLVREAKLHEESDTWEAATFRMCFDGEKLICKSWTGRAK